MLEMVYVGNLRLIGEVIMLSQQQTTIQVYEDTAGLAVGEPVTGSGVRSAHCSFRHNFKYI